LFKHTFTLDLSSNARVLIVKLKYSVPPTYSLLSTIDIKVHCYNVQVKVITYFTHIYYHCCQCNKNSYHM